jgi:hypothetical protein
MEEEVIIILTPKKTQRLSDEASGYDLHTVGGDLTKHQKREILRALLKDLRED